MTSLETNKEELEDFLASLEDLSPIIPDEVITYYLNRTGFTSPDTKVKRLIGLAAQKFLCDVANDALQYCKTRQQAIKSKKDRKLVLTMEDLAQSLKDYGVNVKKPEVFIDKPQGK